jgi:hypothetical protein
MNSNRVNVVVGVFLLSIATQAWAAALKVEIQSPKKDEEVGVETMVTGKVSDPSSRVYVLIRPLRRREWWVQRMPAPPSREGEWETYCYFGTDTEGGGEPYEIIAIASKARLDLKEGQKLDDVPDQGVHSDIVRVRRKQ